MAANTLTAIQTKILAKALPYLREQMPVSRVINMDYSNDARKKGATIDVEVTSTASTYDITPSATHSDPDGDTPTTVPITLGTHKGSSFKLTDKERAEIDANGYLPGKVTAAMSALGDKFSADVLADYHGIYNVVGSAGSVAFSNATDRTAAKDATKAVAKLNGAQGVIGDRWGAIDENVYAEALALPQFANADQRGHADVVSNGIVGRQYGIDWFQNTQIATHTAGDIAGTIVVNDAGSALSVGDTSVTLDGATSGGYKKGDIISFAGHTQTYAVTADVTQSGGNVTVAITPGLVEVPADGAAVTLTASHRVNIIAERDAIAGATRVLDTGDGETLPSLVDVPSALAVRLETIRQNKQTKWEFDILYGHKLVRAAKAVRLLSSI